MPVTQVRWNLFLPPELLARAKSLAEKHGVTASDVVRTAMEKYLTAVEKRDAARAD